MQKLNDLRETALKNLRSESRFETSAAELNSAKVCFANCILAADVDGVRTEAAGVIYHSLNAIMLFNGEYFKRGSKRTFEELSKLNLPFNIEDMITTVITSQTEDGIRESLKALIIAISEYLTSKTEKQPPKKENLQGTYEEMFSNWRNKMYDAAKRQDIYSSFMNTASLGQMLSDISQCVETDEIKVFERFNPNDTKENARLFDSYLEKFLSEYEKANIKPEIYENADELLTEYNK